MTYIELCKLLVILAFSPTCPQPGQPVPEPVVRIILIVGGWPEEHMTLGMHIAMRETYHHTDENGMRYIYPWGEPNWGNFEDGARGDSGMALGMWQIHHAPWHDYCGFTGDPFDPLVQTRELARCVLDYDIKRNQLGQQWSTAP